MNMIGRAVLVAALALGLLGCEKTKTDNNKTGAPSPVIAKADQYAIDVLGTYYLWNDEIKKDLVRLSPDTCRMPMEVVKSIRYHEGGKEVDKWTMLTDDLLSFRDPSRVKALPMAMICSLESSVTGPESTSSW